MAIYIYIYIYCINIGSGNGFSHYLNRYWLIIDELLWRSPKTSCTESVQISIREISLKNILVSLLSHLPRANELIVQGCSCLRSRRMKVNLLRPSGPNDDRGLSQHWLGQWLVAWRHQAITRTNVELSSVRSSENHLRAISQKIYTSVINY